MTNFKNLRAWCLTDGSAGMISQVKGLAGALNLNFEQKTIDLKFPWNKLPVGILPPSKIIFNNYRQISLESNIPPDIIVLKPSSTEISDSIVSFLGIIIK